jgi:uncharacterized protein (DUF779 family)
MSDCREAVTATPGAVEMLERLARKHGPLELFQSGGCCDGSSPICLEDGELPPGVNDLRLGEIASAPFYVDSEQYERWNEPELVLDVGSGAPEGFSLGEEDAHLVALTRPRASVGDQAAQSEEKIAPHCGRP